MSTARTTGGSSVFTVLYAPTSGSARQRRRWLCGRMYVGFDRTTLVDDESHKAVCVASGTGIRPNAGYAMMQAAGNGAEWQSGTELALPRYAVQIEEVMHLHLLPYAAWDGSDAGEGAGPEQAGAAWTVTLEKGKGNVPPSSRRSSHELLRQLENAYPHFYA
ncbi:uncharacterized protein Tco025E_04097 [Trypanosoma conorhini]|uniref:Uncharacterized protein n=1 Tax=Trypanosoma conorhini TaxID=83891 RepID=A0A422PP96_9TRYP|nr:uncharacterized protein Tco025E_04097 [Trypanosoma conorhini]RNF19563.1 hypothetical protein Tco025E_04097 [Trypanosoma conorhini]